MSTRREQGKDWWRSGRRRQYGETFRHGQPCSVREALVGEWDRRSR